MSLEPSAPPRLIRLDLQGFKSFANRTTFRFEPGITAIIGPNGSGKSNISDGVRWVLGEQSHSLLRSKKTEDVIFAGGNGRAPGGFAEVSVTFDNSTGWLPIEYGEVTVTRRATRAGENTFFINGRKVRMKDVHQLTASLGQSYTVVGQGLVDAALSQRADERRGLFEHAADLAGLRMKAAEAERNLDDAQNNAARISDLLAEVEPRLRTLERAARQAREWQGVRDRLRELELGHLRRLYLELQVRVERAEEADRMEAARLGAAQAAVEDARRLLDEARDRAATVQAAHGRHMAHLRSASDRARQLAYERDLVAERIAALDRRREDAIESRRHLDERLAALEREIEQSRQSIETLQGESTVVTESIPNLEFEVGKSRESRQARDRQRQQLAAAVADLERKVTEYERAERSAIERIEALESERARHQEQADDHAERLSALRSEIDAVERSKAESLAERAALQAQIAELERSIVLHRTKESDARALLARLQQERAEARAHLDALERIQESGAGLFAGVRAVLSAARAGSLSGIEGTVAESIIVPAAYDTAIEVALGSHLQDIVTRRWADAQAAIEHLKATKSGRATFQPLDTLRPVSRAKPAGIDRLPGVHGVAADLVSIAPDMRVVTEALLGRTIVVEDLAAARGVLGQLPGGWSAVTLSGEIARSGGSVTGGSAVRENGMLTRERERRELPDVVRDLDRRIGEAARITHQCQEELAAAVADHTRIERAALGVDARIEDLERQARRLATWIREQESRDGQQAARHAATEERLAELLRTRRQLERDRLALEPALVQARRSLERAEEELGRDAERSRELDRRLADALQQRAVLDERYRAERRQLATLLAQHAAVAEQTTQQLERAAAFDGERGELERQLRQLESDAAMAETERQSLTTMEHPIETEVEAALAAVAESERILESARQRSMQVERERNSVVVLLERVRGEMQALRQRISDDLDLADPNELLALAADDLDLDPIEAEREIGRLKERLRRVGYVGEDVVLEYERESERYQFLREQLDDVLTASAALRELLAELRTTMQQRFETTFREVSQAFSRVFSTLFGGGSAELVLIDSEDGGVAGVDIVAQPPGKRLQSLALLSGGERALTAAALLFAILEVNPSPFVLLDEVDAALDEANVVRFREHLRSLAQETQAIIITHNRGTIEVAESLYGVSMREDGVSTVLSMRMAGSMAG